MPCPDALAYLVEWAFQLAGRSGEGMTGAAPLSFATIRDWQETMGVRPLARLEVVGLLALDAAIRHPEEEAVPETSEDVVHRAWPTAKEAARG